jgi:hypothetical protein
VVGGIGINRGFIAADQLVGRHRVVDRSPGQLDRRMVWRIAIGGSWGLLITW